jgi:hypothetical protein
MPEPRAPKPKSFYFYIFYPHSPGGKSRASHAGQVLTRSSLSKLSAAMNHVSEALSQHDGPSSAVPEGALSGI